MRRLGKLRRRHRTDGKRRARNAPGNGVRFRGSALAQDHHGCRLADHIGGMRHHRLRPDGDSRRRQPFGGLGVSPGSIQGEVLQQQVNVAAIHGEKTVARRKRIVLDREQGAVERIDQQDAVVHVCRETQAGDEIRGQRELVVCVVQTGNVGHADFVEVEVRGGGGYAVEPGLYGQHIEVKQLFLPVDGSVVSGIHARQVAEIRLLLSGCQILRVPGGRSRNENKTEDECLHGLLLYLWDSISAMIAATKASTNGLPL